MGRLQVTFTDGKDVKAKVMGVDEDKDLAVLIVDPAKLGTEVRGSFALIRPVMQVSTLQITLTQAPCKSQLAICHTD